MKAFPLSKNVKHQKAHKRPPSSSCFWFVGERKCIWLEGISERGRPGATCSHGDQRSQGRHSHRPVWSNTIVEVFPHPFQGYVRWSLQSPNSIVPDLPKASVVLPPLVSLSGVWTNSTQEGLNALLDFTHSSCLGNFREFFHDNNIGRYFLGRFEALRGGTEFRTTHVGANKNPCTSFVELCGIFP